MSAEPQVALMDIDEPQSVSFSPIYIINSSNLTLLPAFDDDTMFGLYNTGTDDFNIRDGM